MFYFSAQRVLQVFLVLELVGHLNPSQSFARVPDREIGIREMENGLCIGSDGYEGLSRLSRLRIGILEENVSLDRFLMARQDQAFDEVYDEQMANGGERSFSDVRPLIGMIAERNGACHGYAIVAGAIHQNLNPTCGGPQLSRDQLRTRITAATELFSKGCKQKIPVTGECHLREVCHRDSDFFRKLILKKNMNYYFGTSLREARREARAYRHGRRSSDYVLKSNYREFQKLVHSLAQGKMVHLREVVYDQGRVVFSSDTHSVTVYGLKFRDISEEGHVQYDLKVLENGHTSQNSIFVDEAQETVTYIDPDREESPEGYRRPQMIRVDQQVYSGPSSQAACEELVHDALSGSSYYDF